MRWSQVASLIRRASAIRGLALVLNSDDFLETLRRVSPPADLRAAKIANVSLRAPTRCRVSYRVDVGGTTLDLDVFAGRREEVLARRSTGARPLIPGPLGPGQILLEDSDVLVNVFPNDHKLMEVPRLTDPSAREPLLRELVPDHPDLWRGELHPVRYRPERRYVGELRCANGAHAAVKCCTKRAYGRSQRNAAAFRSDGPLRIASLIGSNEKRCLLAYEWLQGRSLFDLYSSPEMDSRPLVAAGTALAAMHAQRPDGLTDWMPEFEAIHVSSVSKEIGFVCPELSQRAEALAHRIQERLPSAPVARAAIHGDISARHVLVDERDVGIIDLDWACYGDPADDLGYLVAGVERNVVRGKLPPDRTDRVREALLEGYGGKDDPDFRRRIDLYTVVGLFQQARFPFRSWTPDWPQETESLLARTEAHADRLS